METEIKLIEKDGRRFLSYQYDEQKSEVFEVFEDRNGKRWTRKRDERDSTESKYYLIQNQRQIDDKLDHGDCDFRCHIFLITADFRLTKFNAAAYFNYAEFNAKAYFSFTEFNAEAEFSSAEFNAEANFTHAKFNAEADFSSVEFDAEVNFYSATFNAMADFLSAKFNAAAGFISAKFDATAAFSFAKFNAAANFHDAKFSKNDTVDFQRAIFKNALNFTEIKQIKLNLKQTILNQVYYGDCRFSSDARETFLILKNTASKQNDQIKALEFHRQEYKTHFKSLKWWSKNIGDKLILGFERIVSNFGTSVGQSVISFVCLVVGFYFIIVDDFCFDVKSCMDFISSVSYNIDKIFPSDFDVKSFVDFISPVSYDIDKIFPPETISGSDRFLFLIYKFLQITLIYEMIKSFRKFSRKL